MNPESRILKESLVSLAFIHSPKTKNPSLGAYLPVCTTAPLPPRQRKIAELQPKEV